MSGERVTITDPQATVSVEDSVVQVVTVGVSGPAGPPTVTPGAVIVGEGDLIFGSTGGTPDNLAIGASGTELVPVDGYPAWRDIPSRNILDVIDPVAADHTDEVKAAFVAYPHWHIPPGVTVKLEERLKDLDPIWDSDCIVIPYNGSLVGQDPDTSKIQITTDQNVSEEVDGAYSVFLLGHGGTEDTQPRQHIAMLNIVGSAPTPMVWTNDQASVFYENTAASGGPGQEVIRNAPITFERVRFSAYRAFPTHIESSRSIMRACDFIDVGNGVNNNGNRSAVEWCYFERAEGCEMSGIGVSVVNNVFVDVLAAAVSVGGFFTVDHPEYNASLVFGNRIYGMTDDYPAIIVAQSMSDTMIVNNYIESAYIGIQAVNDPAYLTNGILIQGNTIVSAALQGIRVGDANTRILDNRIYRRADLGTMTVGLALEGDDLLVDGNVVDGAATYSVDFTGCQRVSWGRNNVIGVGGSGFAYQLSGSPTFVDAAGLATTTRTITGGGASIVLGDRRLFVDPDGANQTGSFFNLSAAGLPGYELFVQKITDDAFTWTLDPFGSETINGETTYVLRHEYDAVKLVSDGTNWVVESQPMRSTHGVANIADGGTIAHGLGVTPTYVGLTPKVGGRIVAVSGLTSTDITVDIKDHAGSTVGSAMDVLWRAEA